MAGMRECACLPACLLVVDNIEWRCLLVVLEIRHKLLLC